MLTTYNSNLLSAKTMLAIMAPLFLTACSECYSTDLQLRAAYERCHDLGNSWSPKLNTSVRTFVCTTPNGDAHADFIVRDAGYCRTHRLEY